MVRAASANVGGEGGASNGVREMVGQSGGQKSDLLPGRGPTGRGETGLRMPPLLDVLLLALLFVVLALSFFLP